MKLVILVVNDSVNLAHRFAKAYDFDDWEAEVFADRSSAIEALKGDKHYDIILTNQTEMEDESMEFTREVCSIEKRRATPIVILSDE